MELSSHDHKNYNEQLLKANLRTYQNVYNRLDHSTYTAHVDVNTSQDLGRSKIISDSLHSACNLD